MFVQVTAKNVGGVFLWDTVYKYHSSLLLRYGFTIPLHSSSILKTIHAIFDNRILEDYILQFLKKETLSALKTCSKPREFPL